LYGGSKPNLGIKLRRKGKRARCMSTYAWDNQVNHGRCSRSSCFVQWCTFSYF